MKAPNGIARVILSNINPPSKEFFSKIVVAIKGTVIITMINATPTKKCVRFNQINPLVFIKSIGIKKFESFLASQNNIPAKIHDINTQNKKTDVLVPN